MKKILERVSVINYPEFRKRALEATEWSANQYNSRRTGRTELTPLERKTLEQIADELEYHV